jgi:AcrR family transcriptional regulator
VHSSMPTNIPPASLRSSTDRPTATQQTSIGLTTTPGWPCALAYSALSCIGFQKHSPVENMTLSVSVIVRPQWCTYRRPTTKSSKACPLRANGNSLKSGMSADSTTNLTTLAAIGERAGYSHGLVTRRFGSKEGLLEVLIERMISDWKEHELRQAIGSEVGIPAIQAMINAVRESIRRSPPQMRALYGLTFESLKPTPGLRERMVDVHRGIRRQLVEMIVAGIAEGAVDPDADPDSMATIVISGLRGNAFQWLLEPDDFDVDAALRALAAAVERLLAVRSAD